MNIRERWICALNHEEPDQVPIHDSLWEETVERWRREGLEANVSPADYFGYEMVRFLPDLSPQFEYEVLNENEEYIVERNPFGEIVKNQRRRSTTPEVIKSPVTDRQDWEAIKPRLMPEDSRLVTSGPPLNPCTYVPMERAHSEFLRERNRGRFITYGVISGYDLLQRFLGSKHLLMTLVLDPPWVREMHEAMVGLSLGMYETMTARGFEFDGIWVSSDLGYRNGLLFSPKCYQEIFFPGDKMLCDYFRGKGKPIILHTDGCVKALMPSLIDAGYSCLQPLEVKAGMDVIELKKEYGHRLSFMGGIDVRLMNEPNANLIEDEIRTKFGAAKIGGGYLYHSDHSVPNDVSLRQYERVLELVRKYGKY